MALALAAVPAAAAADPPQASFSASPSPSYPDEQVALHSTSTGTIVSWTWDLDGDGNYGDAKGPDASTAFASAGKHTVGLHVDDSSKQSSESRQDLEVITRPQAGFTFSPQSPKAGEAVQLHSTSTGSGLSYDWSAPGRPDFATTPDATITFDTAGSQEVTLTVTDRRGTVAQADQSIPVASPFAASTSTPAAGQPVSFDADALGHVHGGATDYRWDLNGDGSFERDTHHQPGVALVYGSVGSVPVHLLVTYADGTTQHAAETIQVGAGTAPPVCRSYCQVSTPLLPQQADHPAPGSGCELTLHFGVVEARVPAGSCLRRQANGSYLADGSVRVDGIDLYPQLNGRVAIDPHAGTISSSAPVIQQFGELLGSTGGLSWSHLNGSSPVTVPDILPDPGSSLEGMQFAGRQHLTLAFGHIPGAHDPTPHGYASIGAWVALPDFFGSADAEDSPSADGPDRHGFSVSVALQVDNVNGLALQSFHLSLPTGSIKGFPIKNLAIDYDAPMAAWGGALDVALAGNYEVAAGIGLRAVDPDRPDGDLTLDHLSAAVGGLNIGPIGDGVYIQGFSAAMQLANPTASPPTPNSFTGTMSLSEGPKYHGVDLIQIVGGVSILWPPPELQVTGELDLLSFRVGTALLDYHPDRSLATFDGSIRIPYWENGQPVPDSRFDGEMTGFWDGHTGNYQMSGSITACVLGGCVPSVQALVSNRGAVACWHGTGIVVDWPRPGLPPLPRPWFVGCDVGSYSVSSSSAKAAGTARTFAVKRRSSVEALRIHGQGDAPRVVLTGPGGERFVTPSVNGKPKGNAWILRDPGHAETVVALAHPAAGRWTVTPDAGSAPITRIDVAGALPPVSIRARVLRRHTLAYRIARHPGQSVVFFERGRGGVAHELGTVRGGGNGRLRFTPAYGPAGKRRIFARVLQGGMPRSQIAVGSYRAPKPPAPAAPQRLRVKRRGRSLFVSWRRVRGAHRYVVAYKAVNRRRGVLAVGARRHTVTIPDIGARERVQVAVRALDPAGHPGHAATHGGAV
jgi:PKD repeat protein